MAIRDLNSRTIITWDHKMLDGNKIIFGRAFWAFGASIDGFQYCHPLINIDGTHLYGMYKKRLLVIVVDDVNNEVYSLFFAIVEEDTNNNWSLFLDLFRQYVIDCHTGLCIISNIHASIKSFMARIFLKLILLDIINIVHETSTLS